MMPVVRGETETRQLIVLYTVLLVALTLMPVVFGYFGADLRRRRGRAGRRASSRSSLRLWREAERRSALRTYLFSLAYLALLFLRDGARRPLVDCRPPWTAASPARTSGPPTSSCAIMLFMFAMTWVAAWVYNA